MPKLISAEEKVLRAIHGLFILQAAQIGMTGAQIRKILGVAMSEVTPVFKVVNKLLKKRDAAAGRQS